MRKGLSRKRGGETVHKKMGIEELRTHVIERVRKKKIRQWSLSAIEKEGVRERAKKGSRQFPRKGRKREKERERDVMSRSKSDIEIYYIRSLSRTSEIKILFGQITFTCFFFSSSSVLGGTDLDLFLFCRPMIRAPLVSAKMTTKMKATIVGDQQLISCWWDREWPQ